MSSTERQLKCQELYVIIKPKVRRRGSRRNPPKKSLRKRNILLNFKHSPLPTLESSKPVVSATDFCSHRSVYLQCNSMQCWSMDINMDKTALLIVHA